MNRNLIKSFWLTSALGSVLLIGGLLANNAAAFLGGGGAPVYTGPIPNSDFKAGFVLARSIVLDPDTGEPILVEFGSDGNEIAPVDIGEAKVLDLIVYPAADYRFHQQRRDAFIEQYKESIAQDAEVMTRNEFEQAQFLYADNKTQIAQDELDENVKSVLVRAQKNRFVPFEGVAQEANEILVLLEFDVDLTQQIEITPQHQSLVLNQDGQVTTASNNTIGYRVGFFGDPTSAEQAQGGRIQNDDTVYGPVPGARVYVDELVFPGSISNTANDGRYSFSFNMPPCPLGGFTYTTDVWAELRYKNFLPTGTPSIPYFLRTPGYSSCFAQLVPAAVAPAVIGIQATTAIPNIQSNLYVDVMFLTGRIVLKNSLGEDVPVGDTSYTTFEKPADYQTQQFYDFDGDGESDHVEQGRLLQCTSTDGENDAKSLFLPDSINAAPLSGADDEVEAGYACNEQDPNQRQDQGGNWQGVYFAGAPQGIEDEPDLVRVIDAEFRDREIGVLKTISKEDMRNTDVYLFRESTGQLILERRGLKEAEAKYRRAVDYDQEQNEVAYRIMLRGNRDYNLNLGGGVDRRQSFEEWATDYQLAEPLRQREADHPRPGEFIKVVAINRATGYTGTARVKLQGAAAEESAGMLDVETPVITLGPPNLKIWAERDYEVEQGLTKGEERSYQIGNEGAALTSDTIIKLYTEWLDSDGRPLPEELGLDNGEQYGLTGRFAKVVGNNQLKGDSVSSDLAEFAIAPGRNTQALRLKGQAKGTEHFYIHVIGKAKEQECVAGATCPSFDLPNNQAGLEGRPQLLTPFLTPLWDEDKHWQEFRAYRNRINELEEEFEDQEIPEDLEPIKPLPAYAWEYRPEYQFSQFEFELAELNRANQDADGNEITINIIDADTPTIASSDDYVEALYSLIDANFEPLNPVDGGQELILALGEQEQRVTFGEDRTIRFDDIGSLANLDVEDLLSLRLYSNNDAGNVLWEYAFEFLGMIVGTNPIIYDGEIFVDADEPELEVSVFLVGENRSDSSYRVRLSVIEGDAEISPSISVLEDGVADAILIVSPMVNNRVRIGAELIESEDTLVTSEVIKVKAGLPVRAEMISQGDLHTGEVGEMDVLARIFDTHGNPVSDGTPVSFNSSGGHYVSSAEPATNDGVAKAKLKGSYRSGSFPLGVESGRAINEIPISVLPLTVNFESLPSSFIAGSTYSLTARLQTDSGIAGGAYAYIGAKGAVINQSSMISDAQGRISFRLSLPSDSQEEITLFAKSSLNDITRIEVPVLAEAVSMKPLMSFEKNYKSVESKSTSNTILEFQESQNLVFDDPHFPNKAPIYLSRFSNVRNDDNGAYSAEYNVFRNKESLYENFYSIEFKQRGSGEADFWALKDSDKLAKEHPHIAFWIKLESEGLILDAQNERLKIAYSNGSLSASIKSNAGIQNFGPINVDPDRWYKVAVGTTANSVFFAVGDTIERVSTDSASIDWNRSDKWLEFGKGFGGKLSGLRIYDSESVDLIEITPSGLEINDLDLDYNSTVAVSLDDQKVLMPILTAVNRDIYHSTLRRVFTDNSLLNEYFTIESVFPSAEQPMSSIFSSVNQEPSFGPLESLLVSTDWIGLRADFKEIKPYIQTLHDFYSRSGQSEIIAALSDELSRSLNEARAGNEMHLLSMRTGLLVLSELIHTRPQAGSIIGDAIKNRKDLWVWLRYLSMPGEGWAGPIIPIPKPENTCDIIDPVVNIGTFLSYNPIPCRVNGELVGDIVLTWVDLDPEVATDKTVLTRYLEVMVSGLTGAPLELTKLVFADAGSNEQNRISSNLLIEDAHANPALLIARLMVFALKTGAKAGYSSAPANMANFLKNKTNSRFSSTEILGAMAYLESRRPGGVFQCESCKLIDSEVFEQIDKNYRAFFNGLSLAKDGDIVEGDVKRRVCMLANQAHGAALEIVGTAAYHALYEFGELGEYEILSADSYVGIPIREPGLFSKFTDVKKGDYRRVPDLILKGKGEERRTWIEFKSWSKGRGYVKRNELQGSRFNPWNMTKHKYQFQHGHRQHMLDYIASRGQIENIWNTAKFTDNNGQKIDNIDNLNNRAGDHRTWIQVWDSDKTRFYEPIVRNKKTDKWEISKNTIPINLHTPWIDSNGIITDSQVQLSDFKLLQEYLTQSPKNMGDKAFRMSIGYPKNQHRRNYVSKQVGKAGGTVAPFTLLNVLQQEAGEKVASEIYSDLSEQVAGSPFAEYLNGGDLSAEQIEKLRAQVEQQVLENFGFIGDALEAVNEVTPDWWLRLEESLQDSIAGMVGDDARDFLAGFEVPDAFKDYLCEVEGEGE